MAQATSGEKLITVDGEKYKVRTQVVYQDGLGVPGTLSTTAPIRYTIEYKPLSPSPLQQWITLGERDNTNQNNWIFTPAAGAGFQKALIANGPNSLTTSLDDAASNALSKSSGVTKQQANQILQVAPNVVPTAPAPVQPAPVQPTFPGANPSRPDPDATTISTDVLNLKIDTENPNPQFTDLAYPTNIRNNGQDFIKFTTIKYIPRKLDLSQGIGIIGNRREASEKEILGSVILPIQPSISDSNNVDWNGLGIDPLGMTLVDGSLNLMSGTMTQDKVDTYINGLSSTFQNENVKKAIKLYFAQKAAGVSGLLSRVSGAIVNPNLELLFQGPTLRPFNFTFRLSPRDQGEAKIVRQIIRVFKQYSAVGTASGGLFLTTPNVFKIQYVSRGSKGEENDHKSLNRIKTCALKSVNVDYTPDGSYMTFNDEARTMTSYNLSLQFQELEPVTTSDYNMSYDQIGY